MTEFFGVGPPRTPFGSFGGALPDVETRAWEEPFYKPRASG